MKSSSCLVRIEAKHTEAVDIDSFELVSADGQPLPTFSAGSHIDVELSNGLVRQYSLCNDPIESHRYVVAVLRDPQSRGGSVAMHALQVGQTIRISEPKNHFELASDADHSILIAGGIGVTPLLCMAEHLSRSGASFEFHYSTRSLSRTAFAQRMKGSRFGSHVQFHYDDGDQSQKLQLNAVLSKPHSKTHVYVCGPTGFMDWVISTARDLGWSDDHIHREYFAGVQLDTSADGNFEVEIASTGQVITVGAEQSVIMALGQAGIEVSTSCEQGVCGTCMVRVLDGTPDHRDLYLTPQEREACDQFMPCCSRSKSTRLVLDL